ncbi:hypothetical protein [Streptomyces sp. enrichment culture]|uniref:hypothetical protein n=1 Tax=Streptomyces sp. enrichment culture TaxID=1795815 RepID=UPI003F54534A
MPLHAGEHRAVGLHRPVRLHRSVGLHRAGPGRRRVCLCGLVGVVVCAVVLPFAVASAGPAGDGGHDAPVTATRLLAQDGDDKAPGGPGRTPAGILPPDRAPLPPGPATAVRCGPELTSPGGVEAQTCVLVQGTQTWARTYYRNSTGIPLESVLSLIEVDGHSLRTLCAVSAEDAPGTCETPRERATGGAAGYTAVAEFARRAGYGPLLLRAGSNGSAGGTGAAGAAAGAAGDEGDASGGDGTDGSSVPGNPPVGTGS